MARRIIERGGTGSIVNIASLAGLVGWANLGAYSMAKGGLVNLTRTLAAEWGEKGPGLETILSGASPGLGSSLVGDIVTHTQDARGALREPGGRDTAAVNLALDGYAFQFGRRLQRTGIPAVRLVADGREIAAGEGAPAAAVRGTAFELLRSLTGRRTPDQIRALDWDGDPEPYLPVISSYGMPAEPIIE